MNSTKITTFHLTNVEDTLQIKSYFELYEGIFNNVDFSSKNENLELQLNSYCNSLNSAIKSILEYIKTHNVDVEYHFILARKINNILYEFKNKMQEFGIAIDNSENIREAYLFYKAIAKSENLLPVKTYLYNSDEREKEFLDYIKIESPETKEPETKSNTKKDKTKEIWFIVGVMFATGEMQKLFKEMNKNATQTAKHLGNESYRPFISETVANTNKKPLNIYSRKKKDINLILEYCKTNNLEVCQDFKDKIKHIIFD